MNNKIELKAIVAVDENWAIGKNNNLLIKIPEDMEFFKDITLGNIVVMGRKTFESIGKALKSRDNIVLTHSPSYKFNGKDIFVCNDYYFEKIILRRDQIGRDDDTEEDYFEETIFIIGGASIYKKYYKWCEEIYVTLINETFEDADAFFPKLVESDFILETVYKQGEYKGIPYRITKWVNTKYSSERRAQAMTMTGIFQIIDKTYNISSEDGICFNIDNVDNKNDSIRDIIKDYSIVLNSPWDNDSFQYVINNDEKDPDKRICELRVNAYDGVYVSLTTFGKNEEEALQNNKDMFEYLQKTYNPSNEYF